jgi:hypothetical protein
MWYNHVMDETQRQVLNFMAEYQRTLNRPPTLNEIVAGCTALNWRSSALYVINNLVALGHLEITAPKNCGRRYTTTERSHNETIIPQSVSQDSGSIRN